jgi:hypothetical protein
MAQSCYVAGKVCEMVNINLISVPEMRATRPCLKLHFFAEDGSFDEQFGRQSSLL